MSPSRLPSRSPHRPSFVLLACLVALAAAPAAPAQPPPSGEPVFDSELRANLFSFDNFFQAPDGVAQESVTLYRVEGRLSFRSDDASPFELYARGRFDAYSDDLDEAAALGLGLRWEGGPHESDLYVEYETDRPVLDVGDSFETADQLLASGKWAWRLGDDWQLSALADWRRQEFELTPGKDNDFLSGGGAIRYRGFGYVFSPEIGVELGRRDAEDPNEDHDQRDVWIKLRSLPSEGLYLSLRYRVRDRDYDVAEASASNFRRRDERSDWTLAADYRIDERWGVNAYLSYEDADSTKATRVFETTLVGVGATFGF